MSTDPLTDPLAWCIEAELTEIAPDFFDILGIADIVDWRQELERAGFTLADDGSYHRTLAHPTEEPHGRGGNQTPGGDHEPD